MKKRYYAIVGALLALALGFAAYAMLQRTFTGSGQANVGTMQGVKTVSFAVGDDASVDSGVGTLDQNDNGHDPQVGGTQAATDIGSCAKVGATATTFSWTEDNIYSGYRCPLLFDVKWDGTGGSGPAARLQGFTIANSGSGSAWTSGTQLSGTMPTGTCGTTVSQSSGDSFVQLDVDTGATVTEGASYCITATALWVPASQWSAAACTVTAS